MSQEIDSLLEEARGEQLLSINDYLELKKKCESHGLSRKSKSATIQEFNTEVQSISAHIKQSDITIPDDIIKEWDEQLEEARQEIRTKLGEASFEESEENIILELKQKNNADNYFAPEGLTIRRELNVNRAIEYWPVLAQGDNQVIIAANDTIRIQTNNPIRVFNKASDIRPLGTGVTIQEGQTFLKISRLEKGSATNDSHNLRKIVLYVEEFGTNPEPEEGTTPDDGSSDGEEPDNNTPQRHTGPVTICFIRSQDDTEVISPKVMIDGTEVNNSYFDNNILTLDSNYNRYEISVEGYRIEVPTTRHPEPVRVIQRIYGQTTQFSVENNKIVITGSPVEQADLYFKLTKNNTPSENPGLALPFTKRDGQEMTIYNNVFTSQSKSLRIQFLNDSPKEITHQEIELKNNSLLLDAPEHTRFVKVYGTFTLRGMSVDEAELKGRDDSGKKIFVVEKNCLRIDLKHCTRSAHILIRKEEKGDVVITISKFSKDSSTTKRLGFDADDSEKKLIEKELVEVKKLSESIKKLENTNIKWSSEEVKNILKHLKQLQAKIRKSGLDEKIQQIIIPKGFTSEEQVILNIFMQGNYDVLEKNSQNRQDFLKKYTWRGIHEIIEKYLRFLEQIVASIESSKKRSIIKGTPGKKEEDTHQEIVDGKRLECKQNITQIIDEINNLLALNYEQQREKIKDMKAIIMSYHPDKRGSIEGFANLDKDLVAELENAYGRLTFIYNKLRKN